MQVLRVEHGKFAFPFTPPMEAKGLICISSRPSFPPFYLEAWVFAGLQLLLLSPNIVGKSALHLLSSIPPFQPRIPSEVSIRGSLLFQHQRRWSNELFEWFQRGKIVPGWWIFRQCSWKAAQASTSTTFFCPSMALTFWFTSKPRVILYDNCHNDNTPNFAFGI